MERDRTSDCGKRSAGENDPLNMTGVRVGWQAVISSSRPICAVKTNTKQSTTSVLVAFRHIAF